VPKRKDAPGDKLASMSAPQPRSKHAWAQSRAAGFADNDMLCAAALLVVHSVQLASAAWEGSLLLPSLAACSIVSLGLHLTR